MNKVFACIDGQSSTNAVVDCAIWSAQRLDAPLEFLHALERHPERASASDHSGAIGMGAQDALLRELSEADALRAKLAQELGRRMLGAARERATAGELTRVDGRLRHGELVDTVLEMEAEARLFVLGEHHHAQGRTKIHLDHHVERVIRSVKRPVLVAPGERFQAPERFVLAFDGSPTARRTLETVASSPMLAGLPGMVVMAAADTSQAHRELEEAQQRLQQAGLAAGMELIAGEPEAVLPGFVRSQGAALLVMGAYGHSRIRHLIVGSTTTTLLRQSDVPVLILR